MKHKGNQVERIIKHLERKAPAYRTEDGPAIPIRLLAETVGISLSRAWKACDPRRRKGPTVPVRVAVHGWPATMELVALTQDIERSMNLPPPVAHGIQAISETLKTWRQESFCWDAETKQRTPRQTLVMMIREKPPAMPACWERHDDWADWLVSAHEAGVRVVRRVDIGKYSGNRKTHFELLPTKQIDYCSDCTKDRKAYMQQERRCHPTAAPASKDDE